MNLEECLGGGAQQFTARKAKLLGVSVDICPGHVAILLDGAEHILLEHQDAGELAAMIRVLPIRHEVNDVKVGESVSAVCRT